MSHASDLASIYTILVGHAPTQTQLANIAAAYLSFATDAEVMAAFGTTRDLLTGEQLAVVALVGFKKAIKADLDRAAAQAAQAAARAARLAAQAPDTGL